MMERTLDKLWRCIECGKTATGKSDVTRHIEAIHLQGHPGFVCQLCGEAVKTRNAMRQHRKLKHSQIMYWYCWNITLQIYLFFYRDVSNVTVVILALLQDISTPGYRSWKMMLASYVLFAIRLLFRRATWRGTYRGPIKRMQCMWKTIKKYELCEIIWVCHTGIKTNMFFNIDPGLNRIVQLLLYCIVPEYWRISNNFQ